MQRSIICAASAICITPEHIVVVDELLPGCDAPQINVEMLSVLIVNSRRLGVSLGYVWSGL